jgi:hypothetical protein
MCFVTAHRSDVFDVRCFMITLIPPVCCDPSHAYLSTMESAEPMEIPIPTIVVLRTPAIQPPSLPVKFIPQVRVYLTPASHAEYDHMLQVAPHLCRPLAAAMGDLRSGAQCLADHAGDRAGGLAALRSTEGGRGAAERLAGAIRERFAAGAAAGGWRRLQPDEDRPPETSLMLPSFL